MRRLALLTALLLLLSLSWPAAALAADTASAWGEFKDAFEKAVSLAETQPDAAAAEIGKAHDIFTQKIAPQVKAAKSAKAPVLQSIGAAREAAKDGDALGVLVQAETAEKASIGLFLSTFEAHLAEKQVDEAKVWFSIIAAQLKFPDSSDVYKEMKQVEADPNLAKTEGAEVVNAFTAKIIDKIAEEVDEALVAADPKNKDKDMDEAQVKAAEGIGFYLAGQDKIIEKLGFEDAARISGLLHQIRDFIADGNWEEAEEAADVVKAELAEMETAKKISGSEFTQAISQIKANLAAAGKETKAGKADAAKKLIDEAWTGFTRIESQVRVIEASSYVKIEKIFGQIKDAPQAAPLAELEDLFAHVVAIKSGEKEAARASTTEVIFTTFERVQPILFAFLALLGVYPIYLISRAFGWQNKAWRNIGIFIILLIVPVFMEALGRLGVEMKIDALQALSFTVSEWAKMAWTVIVLAAFLFAINGLRAFCAQFGIKAFGVRQEPEEPIQVDDTTVEVL